jgi:uncharacterized protein YceK
MVNRLILRLMVSVAPFLSGCATALNTMYYARFEGGNQVYGGVKLDTLIIKASLANRLDENDTTFTRAWKATLATMDLPLSAVADTLTLPITVSATMLRDEPVPEYRLD